MNEAVKFKVTNRATGAVFHVGLGETVLTAARRAGVHLACDCRGDDCESCYAKVIRGDWHYPYRPASEIDAAPAERDEALLCQAVPLTDLIIVARETQALKDIETRRTALRIVASEELVDDVVRFELAFPAGEQVAYLAGQYLEFLRPNGNRHAFSIACAPRSDGILELQVRRVAGSGFTDFLFEEAGVGTEMPVELPLGTFCLRERSSRPVLCVAGGTGFAPIKALTEQFLANGDSRPITLYWGARTRPELYLDALPRRWAKRHANVHYVPVLSEATAADEWTGRTGLVHEAVLADHPDLSAFDVYISGPPGLVEAGRREFLAAGLPEAHIYYDSWEFTPDVQAQMAGGS